MPFIPHTAADIASMLKVIGAPSVEALFDEISPEIRSGRLTQVPEGINEMQLLRMMTERAQQDAGMLNFMGAGAYEHHIPAAVWDIATRGEFLTSYTPYQAEASQGTLQLLYEYQSMMTELTAMDVSNASLYDGASALAEAILMAIRANKASTVKRILIPSNVHPFYRHTAHAIVKNQDIELIEVDFNNESGTVDVGQLERLGQEKFSALVIAQPNFFGGLEQVDRLTDWAHSQKAFVIAVTNPTALALLKPPGCWGKAGADIVVGEGQPLGIPLASGGPYFGFMCCKSDWVRQMPGRIVGRTLDLEGKEGFTLTLQAREQHIRRSKATSNICTNQGLAVTAASIYMSLMGAEGLKRVAEASHANTQNLVRVITAIPGVKLVFENTFFHEAVIQLPQSSSNLLEKLVQLNIIGGFDLGRYYPQLNNAILVCATETKTDADIALYANTLQQIMA